MNANLVDHLMIDAFPDWRPARSSEYRNGMRAALGSRLQGTSTQCPHPQGSMAFDAWFAGHDEGVRLASEIIRRGALQ